MSTDRSEACSRLQQAIDQAAARQDLFSTLVIRLSGLDTVREHLGYDEADRVVATAQRRLAASLAPGDWLGRLSDHEFIIVSGDCNSPSCAVKGSRRSLDSVRQPIPIDRVEMVLMPHAGIALYPVDGTEPAELLRCALAAVRQAEAADTDPRYAFFDHELGRRAASDFALQQELRSTISQGRFELYLQPKLALDNGALVGAEALIRWPQANGSVRMPGEFLPLAERGRLMRPLGAWVAREACRLLNDWQARGLPSVPLAINVSAEQFNAVDWLPAFRSQLQKAGVDPSQLVVELTESVAVADDAATLERLRNLQAMGAAVSVDDFGVGFSNLSLLTRFRFDEVKLDRSLVQGLDRDDAGARASTSICRAVGQMGRELGMRVVAEGIETQGQHDAAAELGCAWAQGYLYARPMPAAAFEARWLRADAELLQGALSD